MVVKGFIEKEGFDYNDTFSPVSYEDFFKVIMALAAHFDLELYQIDIKIVFLNGDINEEFYMTQPEDFVKRGKEH